MPKTKRITILDLAENAGVDNSTVSLALRDDPRISAATKERIKAIAKKMNYVPNSVARSLCGGKSRLIGVVLSSLENAFFSPHLDEFQKECEKSGYSLAVTVSSWSKQREVENLKRLCESRAEGIICVPVEQDPDEFIRNIESVALEDTPFIFLGLPEKTVAHHAGVDMKRSMETGLDHLWSLGHRRIGFLHAEEKGSRRADLHKARQSFVKAYLKEKGAPALEEDLFVVSDNAYGAVGVAKELLKRKGDRPTAIFCADDMLGRALIAGLDLAGIGVPDEISVLGIDDAPGNELGSVPLASVSLEAAKLACATMRLLMDMISMKTPAKPFKRIEIEPRIAQRASCAPPRAHS